MPPVAKALGENAVHGILLAGGFGQRLNAIANKKLNLYARGKPACMAGNITLTDFSLIALRNLGLKEAHILTCHLPKTIEKPIGSEKYGMKIRYIEESPIDPLDTAGAVAQAVFKNNWSSSGYLFVLSADIAHNVDLKPILENHIKSGAVATIVANPVSFEQVHRFGTIGLDGMPKRQLYKTEKEKLEMGIQFKKLELEIKFGQAESIPEKKELQDRLKQLELEAKSRQEELDKKFEDAMGAWITENETAHLKIQEFKEKAKRGDALSNLNNSSIYLFNMGFINDLLPYITKKDKKDLAISALAQLSRTLDTPDVFSDWGRHIFKWLTEEKQRQAFPFFAYIAPQTAYWRDCGIGEELRQLNMDILDGKLKTGLDEDGQYEKTPWGWKGKNVYIAPSAYIDPNCKSIIGSNVIIGKEARIVHSVIGNGTEIQDGSKIYGSIIFPIDGQNLIGRNTEMIDCLFLGGELPGGKEHRRVIIYTPFSGMAYDNLTDKTMIIP